MDLINRAKNLISSPAREWEVIRTETPDNNRIITGYVIPLAGAAALAAFIGYGFIGVNMWGYRAVGVNWGLYQALSVFLGALLSVFITAFVVDALAPSFGSEKNFPRSLQLVAYAFTPAWVGGLLAIIPAIALIGALFGLYSLYLLYLGLPRLKNTPADRTVGYFVVIIIVTLVVYFVVNWLISNILLNIFGLSYGFENRYDTY